MYIIITCKHVREGDEAEHTPRFPRAYCIAIDIPEGVNRPALYTLYLVVFHHQFALILREINSIHISNSYTRIVIPLNKVLLL